MKLSQQFLRELDAFSTTKISPDFILALEDFHGSTKLRPAKDEKLEADDLSELSEIFSLMRKQVNGEVEALLKNLKGYHPLKSPLTLFSPMGYDRWEVAYTKTLAHLMNPSETLIGGKLFQCLMSKVCELEGQEIDAKKD